MFYKRAHNTANQFPGCSQASCAKEGNMARNKALSTGECRLPSMSHSVSDALHRKRRVDLRAQRYRQQENLHNILNASFQIGGTNAKLEFSLIFFFVSFSFDADSFRLR